MWLQSSSYDELGTRDSDAASHVSGCSQLHVDACFYDLQCLVMSGRRHRRRARLLLVFLAPCNSR